MNAASTRLGRARRLTLAAATLLGACVAAATLRGAPWPANAGWTLLMLVPLLLPLPGLLRGTRRTYAWATLCVAPYFAYGLTEVVANPAARGVAAAILFASLAWFASLVHGLRVTREARPHGQDASAD